jgi:hypothetical protein
MGILGLEPKTHGLKGRRSTIELYAPHSTLSNLDPLDQD